MMLFLVLSVIVAILHSATAHWTYGQQKGFKYHFNVLLTYLPVIHVNFIRRFCLLLNKP
jgi:hypothetical protein